MVGNSAAVIHMRLVSMNITKTLDSQVHFICIECTELYQVRERRKIKALFYPSEVAGVHISCKSERGYSCYSNMY